MKTNLNFIGYQYCGYLELPLVILTKASVTIWTPRHAGQDLVPNDLPAAELVPYCISGPPAAPPHLSYLPYARLARKALLAQLITRDVLQLNAFVTI